MKHFSKLLIICAAIFCSTFAKAGSFTVSGSTITIDLNVASQLVTVASTGTTYTFTLSGGATNAWTGTTSANVTVSGATLTITSAGKTAFSTINITDSQTGTGVAFATSGANTYADNFNITLDNTAGAISFAGSSAFDGSNALNIVTDGYISFPSASSLSTVNGNINLSANMQATPNAFSFSGIKVDAATVQITGTGILTMRARGGVGVNSIYNNKGIAVVNGGVVKGGTTGTTTIEGRGYTGVAGTLQGQGVCVFSLGTAPTPSTITSNGADVVVTGYGASSTAAAVANQFNIGVVIGGASQSGGTHRGTITAGGAGTVTINGYGGSAANPASSISTHMYGVYVNGTNALVSSNGGDIAINGTGGGPDSLADYNHGINVFRGVIQPGTNGDLTITATGGNVKSGGANRNDGIMMQSSECKVQCGLGTGNLLITGTGAGLFNTSGCGVNFSGGSIVTSLGSGSVTVIGYGAPNASGSSNRGIVFFGSGASNISSGGGNVVVTGYGGGIGASTNNNGVFVLTGGFITAGGNGTVTVTGYGGNNTGTGSNNYGVYVSSGGSGQAEAYITSSGGNVTINGTGGGGNASSVSASSSATNYGVFVEQGGYITAGGLGTVSVTGTGGNTSPSGTGNSNYGVYVNTFAAKGTGLYSTKITTGGGNLIINGTGGGNAGTSGTNYGVYNQGLIKPMGKGTLSITGTGGAGGSTNNFGVYVNGAPTVNSVIYPATITSDSANVSITGYGGGFNTSGINHGVYVNAGGMITAGANAAVNVAGYGGTNGTDSYNYGVYVSSGTSTITSGGGSVTVIGTGGGKTATASGNNYGVYVFGSGLISAGGNGAVNVTGTGGNTNGNLNIGISVNTAATMITSGGGNVTVNGTGGGMNTSGLNYGMNVSSSASISAGGVGVVTINAAGGTGTGGGNLGLSMTGGYLKSGGGNININATEGSTTNSVAVVLSTNSSISTATNGGDIIIKGNSFSANTGNTVNAGALNNVYIKPLTNGTPFNIGTASTDVTGSMYISAAEFGLITANKVFYGDANTGAVTLGGAVTGTNDLMITGTSVAATGTGTDITITGKTLSFANGTAINIAINGTTVNTNYTQLNVAGTVDITGTTLTLSGIYTPTGGNVFTIVDATAITGTFTGLADGAIITFNGRSLQIDYTATTVTLTDLGPYVTTNPTNQTAIAGNLATFTAAGTAATAAPTVQWQVSTNGGTSYTDISGATNTTYSFTAASADNGNKYKAVFTNSYSSATTTAATLTVNVTPAITAQPSNTAVIEGNTASFTATASGTPAPTVKWQVNTGSGWSDIVGATSTTYSFTTALSDNGNQYQAVFTNIAGSVNSSAATLTVNSACTPTTSSNSIAICPNQLPYSWNGLTFTAAGSQTKTGLTNAGGCDSSASLNLSVSSTTSSSTTILNCGSYTWNGTVYTTSGSYDKLFTGIGGCDSIATLNLTVVSILPAIIGASAACAGSTTTLSNAISGGVWFTQATSQATINVSTGLVTAKNAGTITIKYTKAGCGSVTKSFTVNPIPVVPTITYAPGTANPQLGAPRGSFCVGKVFTVVGTPSVPTGAWSATGFASITTGGDVSVLGTGAGSIKYTYTSAAGCSNSRTMYGTGYTCAARGVSVSGEGLVVSGDFTMYPNPAKGLINLNVETLIGAGSIVITDLYGKTVKAQALSMGTNTIDIAKLSKGMYFVSTITNEGKTTKKLIVE